MKRHALCIITLFGMIITGLVYPLALHAQTPQAIAYQAIVRDSDGNVLADQQVSFQITIHKDAADGPEVYCETHTATTSPLGLVNLEIGNGTLVFGSFQTIDWSTGVYFLEVEMDPEGGTAYVALGTTQLLSVPYALYSEKTGQTYQAGSGIDITGKVITNTAPDQQVSMYNGSGIDVTGSYPDFTITNTAPDQDVFITEGGGIGVTGGYPNYTLTNTTPDQEVVLNDGAGISTTGTYPDFTVTNTAPNAYHTGDASGSDVLTVSGIQGQPVSATVPAVDQVLQWDGSQWNPATLPGTSPGWSLTGNSGTDPDVNFLGTTDNEPLRFRVNNQSAGEINPLTYNTFLGRKAGMANTSGTYNVFVGDSAGAANTEGFNNTFVGPWSGILNTTGDNNVFVGSDAGGSNTTGDFNIFIGYGAGFKNEEGQDNVFVGKLAGLNNTTGSFNTILGNGAGITNTTGNGNVFLGYLAGYNEMGSDKLYIANSTTNPPLIYGDFSIGNVGLGTINPHSSAKLEVNSASQGFLPPRMTQSQRTAISSPAAGLLVFQTDAPSGYYYYTGTSWVSIEGTGAGAPSSCIDYDGNAYPTFTIGTQLWMAENLRVTHYCNGDAIPNVTDNGAWGTLTTGAYCWYDNSVVQNAKYGTLYNWFAVDDSRGLCPEGWHVPTDAEWTVFTDYLGGFDVAGGKMKSVSALWDSPNIDATNNSGFSGLPGGRRSGYSGTFGHLGSSGFFWSASQYSAGNAYGQNLDYLNAYVGRWGDYKESGFSVRCLKDIP